VAVNRKLHAVACAILLSFCKAEERQHSPFVTPNAPVILISVDTLRADRLPGPGSHIDALRRDSIVFPNAWSHVPLTLPSHASILTGQLPTDHGVRNDIGFPFDADLHPTIPSVLERAGYATGAAVSAYILRGGTGMEDAFDFYDDEAGPVRRAGVETVAVAEHWIGEHLRQPFFFMLHLFEPHAPRQGDYDAAVAAADAALGRFIAYLQREGVYDRALIIFLSDHGEGLGEHGEDEHGIFVYRQTLHVPLLVKLPSSQLAGRSVATAVQLIDVFPTITTAVGLEAPERLKGRSLVTTATAPFAPRRIYGESLYPRIHVGWSDVRSLVDDQFHFIESPTPELYPVADTEERRNVIGSNRRIFADMRRELDIYGRDVPVIGNIDPLEARKLAELGYLTRAGEQSPRPYPDPKDRLAELRMIRAGRFREALSRNPRSADAWSGLGHALAREGKHGQAIDAYKRAIRISPSLAGHLSISIANAHLALGQVEASLEYAQLALRARPGAARVVMARAALARDDLDAASREAAQAISALGSRIAGQTVMAEILLRQGRIGEAAGMVEQAYAEAEAKKLDVPPELEAIATRIRELGHESSTPPPHG
jgi:tetratricopeptide (TPR) repeat protein